MYLVLETIYPINQRNLGNSVVLLGFLTIEKGTSFALLTGGRQLAQIRIEGGKKHGLIIDRPGNRAFTLVAVTFQSAEKPSTSMAQRLVAGLDSACIHEHPFTLLAHDAVY